MNIEERERIFRLNDGDEHAVAMRLRAARIVAGYKSQKDFAEALGINYKTYHAQEKGGVPSHKTVRFLHRNYRIDFNFVYNGDFLQLPGDVQAALESLLSI